MKRLEIIRLTENRHGTFGALLDFDLMRNEYEVFAVTLEKKWADNTEYYSCIPAGTYVCKRIKSPKFGETFEVTDVPKRKEILFHWGNTIKDTTGCILIAEEYGILGLVAAILGSKKRGFKEFMERLKGVDTFELTIHRTLLKSGYSRLKI